MSRPELIKNRYAWLLKGLARELKNNRCPRLKLHSFTSPPCYHYAILIDMAGFKAVNDRLSEDVGDGVLEILSEFLINRADKFDNEQALKDTFNSDKHAWCGICFGGDEFAIIVANLSAELCHPVAKHEKSAFCGADENDIYTTQQRNEASTARNPNLSRLPENFEALVNNIGNDFSNEEIWVHLNIRETDGRLIVKCSGEKPTLLKDRTNIVYSLKGFSLHISHGKTLEDAEKTLKTRKDKASETDMTLARGRFPESFKIICHDDEKNDELEIDLNNNIAFFVFADKKKADAHHGYENGSVLDALKKELTKTLKQNDSENIMITQVSKEVEGNYILLVTIEIPGIPGSKEEQSKKANDMVDKTNEYITLINTSREFSVIRLGGAIDYSTPD